MAEPIEIIIRKGSGGEGTGFGVPGATPGGPSAVALKRGAGFGQEMNSLKAKTNADKLDAMVIAYGMSQVKRLIGYGISQYGNQTGNYIGQAELQFAMEIANNVMTVASTTVTATMASGNPIIGLAAGAISAGSIGGSYAFQRWTLQTNITKLNTYSNIMQERSGGTFANGSRGTDY